MTEDEIRAALTSMEKDDSFNTRPVYVKDPLASIKLISFYEKHMAYLKEHPKINPEYYLANLRTVLRVRS
jgi:hypothetical protein